MHSTLAGLLFILLVQKAVSQSVVPPPQPLPPCNPIHPYEASMTCLCETLHNPRYDALESMTTGTHEKVMDVLLEACRLDEAADEYLQRACAEETTNPLLEDLLRVYEGETPQVMEYYEGIGVDLGWADECLDDALSDI